MARLVQSNIRTLEGALVKLVAYASLTNSQVTTQMAEGILEKYFIAAGAGLPTERGANTHSTFVPAGKSFAPSFAPSSGAGATSPATPRPADRFAAPDRTPYVPKVMRPAPVSAPPPATNGSERPSGAPNGSTPSSAPFPSADNGRRLAGAEGGRTTLTPELIQRVVARQFGIAPDDLLGKKRDRDVTNARQVAMHLLRELTDISLPGIGQLFGGRDHTTVIHACDRVKAQLDESDEMKNLVSGLIAAMQGEGAKPSENPPDSRNTAQTIERPFFASQTPH